MYNGVKISTNASGSYAQRRTEILFMHVNHSWHTIKPADRAYLELIICDALGIAAAGSKAPGIREMLEGISDFGGGDIRPIWTDLRVNAPAAGMALSILIHAWDFDDTHDDAVVHTASVAVASSFAVAQLGLRGGGECLLDGIVVGVQVLSRLARLVGPREGVIRTAGLGSIAAAVAASTTLGLSPEATQSAAGLALTGSLAPYTRQAVVDGSLAKRLQPGLAVQSGITAALLARRGVVGPSDWLAGRYGILPGSELTFNDLFTGEFEGSGIALKPYPACRFTHAALAAAEELLPGEPAPKSIERITVHVPAGDAYALVSREYKERGSPIVDAQFSISWQVAAIAVTGSYGLATLRGPDLADSRISEMARRVTVIQDLPAVDVMSDAVVEVALTSGEVLSHRAPMPGSSTHPLGWDALAAKIDSCLSVAGRNNLDSDRIRSTVQQLAKADSTMLSKLIAGLT
jgi:2-methylcitrate dehydratase PrpD